jgi:SAM-dependent methyltransferase
LVDNLLNLGFVDITVLDISKTAIEKAKTRLGEKASLVKWVVSDIVDFEPQEDYDLWHDRAVFHFLTESKEIDSYKKTIEKHIVASGKFVLGTFSDIGPEKCSGIKVSQYSEESMSAFFQDLFEKIECFTINHETPFDTTQNFTFCIFKRRG